MNNPQSRTAPTQNARDLANFIIATLADYSGALHCTQWDIQLVREQGEDVQILITTPAGAGNTRTRTELTVVVRESDVELSEVEVARAGEASRAPTVRL